MNEQRINWEFWGLIVTILGILVPSATTVLVQQLSTWEDEQRRLNTSRPHRTLIARRLTAKNRKALYRIAIEQALTTIARLMGPIRSFNAFVVCFGLAWFYTTSFVIYVWIVSPTQMTGDLVLFPNIDSAFVRILVLISLIIGGLISGPIFSFMRRTSNQAQKVCHDFLKNILPRNGRIFSFNLETNMNFLISMLLFAFYYTLISDFSAFISHIVFFSFCL